MPKNTAIDFTEVSTEELMTELSDRHEEIVIIRENLKKPDWVDIWTKTPLTEVTDPEVGYDALRALELLHTAVKQMFVDYMRIERVDEDDSDENST